MTNKQIATITLDVAISTDLTVDQLKHTLDSNQLLEANLTLINQQNKYETDVLTVANVEFLEE